jgi:acetate kinase
MALILIINAGSSSVKYKLINPETEQELAKGLVERIGIPGSLHHYTPQDGEKIKIEKDIPDQHIAIEEALNMLLSDEYGVIKDKGEISAIGHRVVHGGEKFSESTLITEEVVSEIRDNCELAPLHNPHNLRGIEVCLELFPGKPQVAVFDTAFHQMMPEYAYLYALPYSFYLDDKIRRYGFHGTSHYYVAHRAAEELGKPLEELRVITAHMGNGCSISAVKNGRSVDTSMGLTPLEGLVMGTRCGDIDPAIPIHLAKIKGLIPEELDELLNKKSGVKGLSGLSSDMREIEDGYKEGDPDATRAFDVYCYRLKKYIGAYMAILGGLDALVFTAGVGENSDVLREISTKGLEELGIILDKEKNVKYNRKFGRIDAKGSTVAIFIIPTNEGLVIARDTYRIYKSLK